MDQALKGFWTAAAPAASTKNPTPAANMMATIPHPSLLNKKTAG
jgi:hypothetical protein